MPTPAPSRSSQAAALAVALPALVAAAWLLQFELRLEPASTAAEPGSTLVSAIREDAIVGGFAHIRAGEDPNAPLSLRDERLTGGNELTLSPLLIAVAFGQRDTVAMLMSSGARLDAPENRYAVCLARRLGHDDVEQYLLRYGGPTVAAAPCPAGAATEPVTLQAFVE